MHFAEALIFHMDPAFLILSFHHEKELTLAFNTVQNGWKIWNLEQCGQSQGSSIIIHNFIKNALIILKPKKAFLKRNIFHHYITQQGTKFSRSTVAKYRVIYLSEMIEPARRLPRKLAIPEAMRMISLERDDGVLLVNVRWESRE